MPRIRKCFRKGTEKTFTDEIPSGANTAKTSVNKAAPINPTTAGFNPVMMPWTVRLSLNFVKIRATIKIIRNDGNTTPDVAHNAPGNLAVWVPM